MYKHYATLQTGTPLDFVCNDTGTNPLRSRGATTLNFVFKTCLADDFWERSHCYQIATIYRNKNITLRNGNLVKGVPGLMWVS